VPGYLYRHGLLQLEGLRLVALTGYGQPEITSARAPPASSSGRSLESTNLENKT
jgi:hypothetical protein